MADLTLYTNPMSRGRIARWMMEEVGEPYDVEVLDYGTTMKAPEYLAINPMGKVPALRHGDVVVTEGAAICAYMADAFPQAGLAPDPADRADYYRWLFFAAGPVEAAVTNRSMGWVAEGPELQGRVGYGSFERVLDVLSDLLTSRAYVCGDRFTAADVYLGSAVTWGLQFGTMDDRPGFGDYVARLTSRAAAERAKAADDALMPAREG